MQEKNFKGFGWFEGKVATESVRDRHSIGLSENVQLSE
jgi:hypothetical protein